MKELSTTRLQINQQWAKLPLFDRSKWERVRFGEVVENLNETCDPAETGLERFIAMEHLEPGSLHIRTWGNMADGTTFTRRCQPGQLLFGKRRAYQRKVAVADFDAVVSGDIYVFAPMNDRLLPELLPFICISERFFKFAVETSAGSLSPRTNWSHLANFEFDLPPLDQQRRIADLTSAASETVSRYEKLLKDLLEFNDSRRIELLSVGFLNHALKPSELGDIPIDWEVATIGEVCAVPIRDFGSFSSTKQIQFLQEGIAFLKSEMIGDFELIPEGMTYVTPAVHEALKKSWVYPGNLLYSKIGSALGKAVIYDGRFGVCNSNAAIAKITVNNAAILPLFLCHLLNAPHVKKRMQSRIVSLLPRINLGDISSFPIPLPPIDQQTRIVSELENTRLAIARARSARRTCFDMVAALSAVWI